MLRVHELNVMVAMMTSHYPIGLTVTLALF
jgi:hypothetical protein